jgi:hypothetical protein
MAIRFAADTIGNRAASSCTNTPYKRRWPNGGLLLRAISDNAAVDSLSQEEL